MRYGHSITSWNGISNWLYDNGYVNYSNIDEYVNKINQIMFDFMISQKMKIVSSNKLYKGKKRSIRDMNANYNSIQIQNNFSKFTEWVKQNCDKI